MRRNKLVYIAVLLLVLVVSCAFNTDVNTGDSVTVFDERVIPAGETVSGDAVAVFGKLEIRGAVTGDVVTVFGNVDIYGEVNGDVVAVFGNISVHKNAVVGGNSAAVFGSVDKSEGAIIKGEVADDKIGYKAKSFDLIPNMSFASIIGTMFAYGLCCLVILFIPDRVSIMAQRSQHSIGRHLGVGLLVFLVFILLIPLLVITIIGIIPAILLIFAFIIATLVSTTAVYVALGKKIAAAVEGGNAVYIHLLIGLVILNALGMIPLLGGLAAIAVFLISLGVAFDTRLGGPLNRKKAL